MRRVRVVLDTNILVGALITRGTPPDRLCQAWLRGEIELVISAVQVRELAAVLARPCLRRFVDDDEAAAIIANIDARAIVVEEIPKVDLSPDPDDNPALAAAIAGGADLVVSGDKKHVPALGEVAGIPIVTARQALERLALS